VNLSLPDVISDTYIPQVTEVILHFFFQSIQRMCKEKQFLSISKLALDWLAFLNSYIPVSP
jgi:hypothetical protein